MKQQQHTRDPRWPPGRRRLCPGGNLLLLLVSAVLPPSLAICPSKCLCNDKLLEARCEKSNLEVVPIQLNPEIKNLRLSNNRISSIHLMLTFYTHLTELDLSSNRIRNLGTKNFESQVNLMKLRLSHNLIKQLHKDTFKGMKNLLVLDLSNNEMEELNERNAFKDLYKLQELNLAGNSIFVVGTGVLDFLIDLRRLLLSGNQLLTVPEPAVNALDNLQEIDLTNNLITDLSFPPNLKNLQVLRLRSNLISVLGEETLGVLYHLRYLDLSDNNITQVPTAALSKLNYLEHLNLSSNLFTQLGPNSFLNLYKLTEIYINDVGSLTKLDSKFLLDNFNLQYVSLSNNVNLRYLPKFLFMNKPHLKHVSISGNDFSTLDASDLPLDQLETLKLGRNPFTCNCSLMWLWVLKERQVDHNCTCTEPSCLEACIETLPKAERLAAREYSEEYDSSQQVDEEEGVTEEKPAKFQSLRYNKEMYPVILDLEEVYCEDLPSSLKVQLKHASKAEFDCTMTWLLILSIAILVIIILFLLAVAVYIIKIRCKKKAKNPVEHFINATKTYEDTHHTYYRYGQALHNGDVFDMLRPNKNGYSTTNMYIKSPVVKETISYPYTMNTFRNGDGADVVTMHATLNKKQLAHAHDAYSDASTYGLKSYVSESNIYHEPFAAAPPPKPQKAPHIVYV